MSPKRGSKGYYKGNAAISKGGSLSKHGRFVVDQTRLLRFVAPDLEGFELKPYVAMKTPKVEDVGYDVSPLYRKGAGEEQHE